MSKYSIHRLKCPYCNKEFSEEIADSLNVTLDLDSFSKVRKGDVFNVICPECKKSFFYNHPFLYHDMNKHFMVQYAQILEHLRNLLNQLIKCIINSYHYLVNNKH